MKLVCNTQLLEKIVTKLGTKPMANCPVADVKYIIIFQLTRTIEKKE